MRYCVWERGQSPETNQQVEAESLLQALLTWAEENLQGEGHRHLWVASRKESKDKHHCKVERDAEGDLTVGVIQTWGMEEEDWSGIWRGARERNTTQAEDVYYVWEDRQTQKHARRIVTYSGEAAAKQWGEQHPDAWEEDQLAVWVRVGEENAQLLHVQRTKTPEGDWKMEMVTGCIFHVWGDWEETVAPPQLIGAVDASKAAELWGLRNPQTWEGREAADMQKVWAKEWGGVVWQFQVRRFKAPGMTQDGQSVSVEQCVSSQGFVLAEGEGYGKGSRRDEDGMGQRDTQTSSAPATSPAEPEREALTTPEELAQEGASQEPVVERPRGRLRDLPLRQGLVYAPHIPTLDDRVTEAEVAESIRKARVLDSLRAATEDSPEMRAELGDAAVDRMQAGLKEAIDGCEADPPRHRYDEGWCVVCCAAQPMEERLAEESDAAPRCSMHGCLHPQDPNRADCLNAHCPQTAQRKDEAACEDAYPSHYYVKGYCMICGKPGQAEEDVPDHVHVAGWNGMCEMCGEQVVPLPEERDWDGPEDYSMLWFSLGVLTVFFLGAAAGAGLYSLVRAWI